MLLSALIGIVVTVLLQPTVEHWRDKTGELIAPTTTGFKPDATMQCETGDLQKLFETRSKKETIHRLNLLAERGSAHRMNSRLQMIRR
jgi:hypothetical protein